MKKIFTLIAVAAMAINANAQESWKVSTAPTDNQTVEATASVKITFGNDGSWITKEDGITDDLITFATGGQNPKDGELGTDKKSTGNGYKPETANLPKSGTYYIFDIDKAGKLEVFVQLNPDKNFYVADATGACLNETVGLVAKQADGTDLSFSDTWTVSEKLKGSITFTIPAAGKYYVFGTGSKLGLYGFTFTAGGESGIASVKAAKANAAEYNLAGQKVAAGFKGLVIKEGKKVIK